MGRNLATRLFCKKGHNMNTVPIAVRHPSSPPPAKEHTGAKRASYGISSAGTSPAVG